jgi:hypothetical protein
LNLGNNRLQTLPKSFGELIHLESCDLNGNDFRQIFDIDLSHLNPNVVSHIIDMNPRERYRNDRTIERNHSLEKLLTGVRHATPDDVDTTKRYVKTGLTLPSNDTGPANAIVEFLGPVEDLTHARAIETQRQQRKIKTERERLQREQSANQKTGSGSLGGKKTLKKRRNKKTMKRRINKYKHKKKHSIKK